MDINLLPWFDNITKEFCLFWEKIAKTYRTNPALAAKLFVDSLHAPRDSFIWYCMGKWLNYSSFWGVLLEWYMFYVIQWWISVFNVADVYEVVNNYRMKYKRKEERQAKSVNVDIVLKSKKTTKLFYCLELKTNFEDGFAKYFKEQTQIYHHRSKAYQGFKYHYISLWGIPQYIKRTHARSLNTLGRREELWCFPKPTNDIRESVYSDWERLLSLLYDIMI